MSAFPERLIEAGAKLILEGILVGVLTLGAALLARNLVRQGKVRVEGSTGHTCMSPYVLLMGLLFALVAAGFLASGFIFPQAWDQPGGFRAWGILVAGFFFPFLAILPFTRHVWEWDAMGLRWHGAWRSASMQWSEIARLGKSWDGQFFAADKSGRKIYWSTYTLEHEALRRAIKTARPDLTPPA